MAKKYIFSIGLVDQFFQPNRNEVETVEKAWVVSVDCAYKQLGVNIVQAGQHFGVLLEREVRKE